MSIPSDAPVPDDAIGEHLDSEITSLHAQIASLKAQRSLQTAALLSSHKSNTTLSRLLASKPASRTPQSVPSDSDPLLSSASLQQTHAQENLYRACASITTFRIQDPDPNAVDGGKVLGIRIDVSSHGKFVRPYYVMLNKPFAGSELMRIHRHTLPPCIPLSSLATQHLPDPHQSGGVVKGKKQDLRMFVRSLRREVIGYHNRTSVIKLLRKEFKLDEVSKSSKGKERERIIVDISAADAEAKQVRIEWTDGRIGRCVVNNCGEVQKCVIIGEDGRDREIERQILGKDGHGRMEGIAERLKEGIY
ncbi:Cenp-O kinetochore centromere component-domain-containing protein [Bisporella sp. PMI_857]|nr:Cenp-O kinetochore centromere component-domain-containing protein [Bisporella sp. PMI_857]